MNGAIQRLRAEIEIHPDATEDLNRLDEFLQALAQPPESSAD